MNRARRIVVVGAVCLAVLAGFVAYAVTAALRSPPAPVGAVVHGRLHPGSKAPPFILTSLSGRDRVLLKSFAGAPVVINFFASWCPNCRAELGSFARAWKAEAGRAGFVGVDSSDADEGEARRLLAAAGAGYPVGTDPSGSVEDRYDVPGLPTTFVLDSRGRVVVELVGQVSFETLRHWIARARST